MKFNNYAYIFLGPNLNPEHNTLHIKTEKLTFTAVGIDFNNKQASIEIAKKLAAEGAQMIELCGGFGPLWITKIMEALGPTVPVGGVFYGPESRKSLLDLLS